MPVLSQTSVGGLLWIRQRMWNSWEKSHSIRSFTLNFNQNLRQKKKNVSRGTPNEWHPEEMLFIFLFYLLHPWEDKKMPFLFLDSYPLPYHPNWGQHSSTLQGWGTPRAPAPAAQLSWKGPYSQTEQTLFYGPTQKAWCISPSLIYKWTSRLWFSNSLYLFFFYDLLCRNPQNTIWETHC